MHEQQETSDLRSAAQEASGKEFAPYVDAATAASQRSRFVTYALIVAVVALLAAYRNTTSPDWVDSRLSRLQQAATCLDTGSKSRGCLASIDYARDFVFQYSGNDKQLSVGSPPAGQGEDRHELGQMIEKLLQRRAELLSVTVPLLGLSVDMNDLGIVGGLALVSLLTILYTCLRRELDNLRRVRAKAQRMGRIELLEQVLMAQVLSIPTTSSSRVKWLMAVMYALPAVVYSRVFLTDALTFSTGALLESTLKMSFDIAFEGACCALIIYLAYRTWRQAHDIDGELGTMDRDIRATAFEDAAHAVVAAAPVAGRDRTASKPS